MEESNMQQYIIITTLEQTYQDFKKQQVIAHIESKREKQPHSTYQDEQHVEGVQGVIAKQYTIQSVESRLGRQKPQVEILVAKCLKVHRGTNIFKKTWNQPASMKKVTNSNYTHIKLLSLVLNMNPLASYLWRLKSIVES